MNDNLHFMRKINSIELNILDIKHKVDKMYTMTLIQNINKETKNKETPCDLLSRLSNKSDSKSRKSHTHELCGKKTNCVKIYRYPYCKKKNST